MKLIDACLLGKLKHVQCLVEYDVDMNMQDALIKATCTNHMDIVQYLVDQGANINIQDK